MKTFKDYGIDIGSRQAGQVKTQCPECKNRKPYSKPGSETSKDLSVDISNGRWKCHRCEWSGFLETTERPEKMETKTYKIPVFNNKTELSDNLVKWFECRGISQTTLKQMKITESVEFMPQVNGETNTLQFNYFKNGQFINAKFRDGKKNFKMISGAELCFYNYDIIKQAKEIIIVEGEMDALSFIECGINNVLSVPNGASIGNNNLQYLDTSIDEFDHVEKIYLATDNDTAGLKLRADLIIRFGAERCLLVDLRDCKDANEYLVKYGKINLTDRLKTAKECKVDGIIQLSDFEEELDDLFANGLKPGATLGFTKFDELITWKTGTLAIVTGIPGHGKSEFIDEILVRLNMRYGWKAGYFSPENHPLSFHASKIISKVTGKAFKPDVMTLQEYQEAKAYVHQNFEFIYPENEDYTLENILEKGRYMVKKRGIKVLVIDPWNRLEHQMSKGETETLYISRQLDKMTMFAQKNDVMVVLMAHPKKIEKKNGAFEVPTLYDISGSANFFNKAFYGLTCYRIFDNENPAVDVHIQKVKFKHLGKTGIQRFSYDIKSGRYFEQTNGEFTPNNDNFMNELPSDEIPF